MRVGISTSIFWQQAEQMADHLKILKNAGFEFIELDCSSTYRFIQPAFVQNLMAAISANKLKVHSIHLPYMHALSSNDNGERAKAVAAIGKVMTEVVPHLEKILEKVLTLVVHPGIDMKKIPRESQMCGLVRGVQELRQVIPDGKYILAFENMLTSHFGSSYEDLGYICDVARLAFPKSIVGVCFDSNHCCYDILSHEYLEKIADTVVTTHISDNFNQPYGEFHALPMTILHSKNDWKKIAKMLSLKTDTIILELTKPGLIRFESYLEIAQIIAREICQLVN